MRVFVPLRTSVGGGRGAGTLPAAPQPAARLSQRLCSNWADVSFHIFLFFPRLPIYSSVDWPGSPEVHPRVGCLTDFQELGVVWGAVTDTFLGPLLLICLFILSVFCHTIFHFYAV